MTDEIEHLINSGFCLACLKYEFGHHPIPFELVASSFDCTVVAASHRKSSIFPEPSLFVMDWFVESLQEPAVHTGTTLLEKLKV